MATTATSFRAQSSFRRIPWYTSTKTYNSESVTIAVKIASTHCMPNPAYDHGTATIPSRVKQTKLMPTIIQVKRRIRRLSCRSNRYSSKRKTEQSASEIRTCSMP